MYIFRLTIKEEGKKDIVNDEVFQDFKTAKDKLDELGSDENEAGNFALSCGLAKLIEVSENVLHYKKYYSDEESVEYRYEIIPKNR